MYESVIYPQKVDQRQFEGHKIVDYALGEDTVVVLTEDGKVYWAGMKINYEFKPMNL